MNLPNIQSQHPDIYASFIEASDMEIQAKDILQRTNQLRINALERLRMRQGWSKSHLGKVIGFQPESRFIFRILQGKYPMKVGYLEKVDAGITLKDKAQLPATNL